MSKYGRCRPGWGWAAGPKDKHGLELTVRWLSSWARVNAEAPKGEGGQGVSPASLLTQEIAEPLFDLKVGMEQLARNHTFKCILATLLAMGNFLNGSQVRSRVWRDVACLACCKDRTSCGARVPERDHGKPRLAAEAGRYWWGPTGHAGWRSAGGEALLSALGFQSRGFELGYLEKVSEVKDTVHRQSLLHHLCQMVVEKFPETTDLYSEIASITRSAKVRQGRWHLSKARVGVPWLPSSTGLASGLALPG